MNETLRELLSDPRMYKTLLGSFGTNTSFYSYQDEILELMKNKILWGDEPTRRALRTYDTCVLLLNSTKEIKAFLESTKVEDGDELDAFFHPVSSEAMLDLFSMTSKRVESILKLLKTKHNVELTNSTRFLFVSLTQNDQQ